MNVIGDPQVQKTVEAYNCVDTLVCVNVIVVMAID